MPRTQTVYSKRGLNHCHSVAALHSSGSEVAAATAIDDQIDAVNAASCMYNDAFVRAVKGVNEAVLRRIESKGIPVERVMFTAEKWATACENLSMLIANDRISYPYDPDLVAELEVFKADSTLGAVLEYTLEVGHNAAIRALCLVTYDQSAEDID